MIVAKTNMIDLPKTCASGCAYFKPKRFNPPGAMCEQTRSLLNRPSKERPANCPLKKISVSGDEIMK